MANNVTNVPYFKEELEGPLKVAAAGVAVAASSWYVYRYMRTGPGRALVLVAGPKFRRLPQRSCRTDLVRQIRHEASHLARGGYLVVTGNKGLGKTTAIQTAFANQPGVVDAPISAGISYEDVMQKAVTAVAQDPANLDRVLFWYRLFSAGSWPLTVVLQAKERGPDQKFADFTGAVRDLADWGMVVVVDASPNSVPPQLLRTLRERVIQVESMSDEQFRTEFRDLLFDAKACGCEDLLCAIMGNAAATGDQLTKQLSGCSVAEKSRILEEFILAKVTEAADDVRDRLVRDPALKSLMQGFQGSSSGKVGLPEDFTLQSTADKVLRKVRLRNQYFLVPANAPVHFVLFHGLTQCPEIDQLLKLAETPLPKWQ